MFFMEYINITNYEYIMIQQNHSMPLAGLSFEEPEPILNDI